MFNWCGRSARKLLKRKTLQRSRSSCTYHKLSLKTIKKKSRLRISFLTRKYAAEVSDSNAAD
jgi:hypothetical protein